MSFNRRGGDRRPDRFTRGDRDRFDRADRGDRAERGDRDRAHGGGGRPYPPRGDRPYSPRPRFERGGDEGGMSIRLDPRRLSMLKQLAGEAGTRPGDLVRRWVEERIDAARVGSAGPSLEQRLEALDRRIADLESGSAHPGHEPAPDAPAAEEAAPDAPAAEEAAPEPDVEPPPAPTPRKRVSAAPSERRIALHDEMIDVIRERGAMTAAELAEAISERGRYRPPRSGKPLDAGTVSQRASNPTYRSRFTRSDGRIGLAE